jgi:zinc transport system substrate-binding protein
MRNTLLIALLLILAACGPGAGDGRLHATVSIPPQLFLVERIGGGRVTVSVLAGPGEDAHSYEPSDHQVSEALRAKIYFRIGVPFENGRWLGAIEGKMRIVDLREGLAPRPAAEGECVHDDHTHAEDPHSWLSLRALEVMAGTVERTLAGLDPAGRETYAAGREALVAEIRRTREEIAGTLRPVAGRPLYVFHPAWGWFCDEFGLRQVAVEFEGKEPSDSELTRLLGQARADGVRVLFVQPQIAGRSAKAIADAVGARLEVLDPLRPDVLAGLRNAAVRIAEALR